jgi:hypothetical protein
VHDFEQVNLLHIMLVVTNEMTEPVITTDDGLCFLVRSCSHSLTRYSEGFVTHRQQVMQHRVVKAYVVVAHHPVLLTPELVKEAEQLISFVLSL